MHVAVECYVVVSDFIREEKRVLKSWVFGDRFQKIRFDETPLRRKMIRF